MNNKLLSSQVERGAIEAPRAIALPALLAQVALPETMEAAAGFGRWWLDTREAQLVLSHGAAQFLNVDAGLHRALETCFTHVVPEDMLLLIMALMQAKLPGVKLDYEFRVLQGTRGLRWLRMQSVPQEGGIAGMHAGVLVDVTAARHIEMRERFSYAMTQSLVGAGSLDEAVPRVIQLVCENLGWEWGAYWQMRHAPMEQPQLACQYFWNHSEYALAAFTRASCDIRMTPGEGFIGHVWDTGQACWIEDMKNDSSFLRRDSARECGLESGYAFPVSYVTADGQRHSVGVLEFFSTLTRQHDAQLPNLSAVIGGLIAQAVQRMEQQEIMRRLAQTDDLTGLANRNYFHRQLEEMSADAGRSGAPFGLLYIDLDRFKPVNDAFGHDAGNLVLREFAQRLQKLAPQDVCIGRLGGDEFAILAPLACRAEAMPALQALAERVLAAARMPFQFEGNDLKVSTSIGISVFAENGWTPQELLRSADEAMYRSKKSGRNAYCFCSDSGTLLLAQQQTSLARQLTMEAELHRALAENEFHLEYQPVFDHYGDRMVAVEALLRWRKPDGEMVPPDQFIPIAEKSRLIVQIGRWVVRQACRDLAVLHSAGLAGLRVNVNMAAPEFTNTSLPYELTEVVASCGIAARHLCLELTEGLVMKQPEKVLPVMQMLRQLGFHISLDDFGIGHSSLSRLKKLPITSLKIDRSFVAGLPHDRGDGAIVRSIIDLGRHMKLDVVAEGVETDAQLLYLAQFGCTYLQGYLLSRPLPLQQLIALHHNGKQQLRQP
ncbi:putative bifunctional diguanylate cyclase/phosphodiesterase [Noviherbaspirillum sedimenti]|uniref:EAL domain-containing protein n=1 Tax=Noviherbaspirillum sedimenti TaxID=2320865 RepID=A0A3A3G1U5_9BURK|nr:EAL domain-containing protein [Noviherbaspirillum sedimenti]RJG02468.1 EAL domain-containing protein [Noviherbaspirillum sedimenti]